jgi:hypothetical protein
VGRLLGEARLPGGPRVAGCTVTVCTVTVCGALIMVAGCSSAPPTVAHAGAACGSVQTAAGVPVVIKVAKGTVNCADALRVENDYAAAIKAGNVAGNGGGAPVTVDGWTCQGYPTPDLLRTGDASQCHSGDSRIVAILPGPA